ncbi:radical SAM protein [Nocardia sp. NPDC049149]|uniref:radical SAM protein n=1 Tax=Nocardia sp. NPDC049149 TaxID=3364315 RepID=UPI00371C6B60
MTGEPNSQHPQTYLTLPETDTATAVSVILKLRGETCDIDCLYCYEKRKEAPGGARIGAEDIRRLPEIFGDRPLSLELHGGEPLTAGKPYIEQLLSELAGQPTVQRVSLQTNGIRLDNSWLDMFDGVYPALRIGISLDGDPEGNAWRVDYDGAPTYSKVATALERLAARGRKVGIITAVTPRVLGRASVVLDHLASFAAVDAISFVPCFDATVTMPTAAVGRRTTASRIAQQASLSSKGPAWAITPTEYVEFVLAAAVRWVHAGAYRRIKLEPIVSAIRKLRGLDTGFCHFSNLKCDHIFTLYPDKRVGSCDELPWPAAQLATLDQFAGHEQVATAQRQLPLLQQGRSLTNKCTDCRYRSTCGGGCIATRIRATIAYGDDDEYCGHRMRLIDGVAALITQPGMPSAVSCQHVHARPKRLNEMHDVRGFIGRWRDPRATRHKPRLQISTHGNINTVGEPGIHEADDLDPLHPLWRNAIEPGVWPLVEVITAEWNLITYDSCEGHAYAGLAIEPGERRVGILPREPAQYARIAAALCRCCAATEQHVPEPIRIVIGRADLTCATSRRQFPVLNVLFERADGYDWNAYFDNLADATRLLTEQLRATSPDERTECGCAVVSSTTGTS